VEADGPKETIQGIGVPRSAAHSISQEQADGVATLGMTNGKERGAALENSQLFLFLLLAAGGVLIGIGFAVGCV
jgi:hypothetical protein